MRKNLITVLLLSIVVSVTMSSNAIAQESQLEQAIIPQDCNYTTVETGNGVVNDIDCPTFPPVIDNITVNDGRPIVVGVYDAIHTSELKVWVDGRWYVYGVDTELTTSGNVWTFKKSKNDNQFVPGKYVFKVETVDHGGIVQSGQAEFTIDGKKNDDNDSNDYIIPGIPNTGIARAGMISIFFIGFVFLTLILLFRRKKRQSDKDL